jgi:anti-sigma regulatory factor (Ser/Thr protein kinase)
MRTWQIVKVDREVLSHTRAAFSAALRDAGRSDEEIEIGGIVLGELLANACEYGHLPVNVALRKTENGLTVVVDDGGSGFTRPAERDPRSLRGRGFEIIEALGGVIRFPSSQQSTVEVDLPFAV